MDAGALEKLGESPNDHFHVPVNVEGCGVHMEQLLVAAANVRVVAHEGGEEFGSRSLLGEDDEALVLLGRWHDGALPRLVAEEKHRQQCQGRHTQSLFGADKVRH